MKLNVVQPVTLKAFLPVLFVLALIMHIPQSSTANENVTDGNIKWENDSGAVDSLADRYVESLIILLTIKYSDNPWMGQIDFSPPRPARPPITMDYKEAFDSYTDEPDTGELDGDESHTRREDLDGLIDQLYGNKEENFNKKLQADMEAALQKVRDAIEARENEGLPPDLEAVLKKLREGIKNRNELKGSRSAGSQTDGIPDAFEDGIDLREKAKAKAGQRMQDAGRAKPKAKPKTAMRPVAPESGGNSSSDGGVTQDSPNSPDATAQSDAPKTPAPAPSANIYDCSVKPYTGPVKEKYKQAQQALIDNYNAHCP